MHFQVHQVVFGRPLSPGSYRLETLILYHLGLSLTGLCAMQPTSPEEKRRREGEKRWGREEGGENMLNDPITFTVFCKRAP